MNNKIFKYNVNLVPLYRENKDQKAFRDDLMTIPYLLYEVENLHSGEKIVINKPGGKRNFGKLSRDDFMVFIYNPLEQSLWMISHDEIKHDLDLKNEIDSIYTKKIIKGLYKVCCGQEPDQVLEENDLQDRNGLTVETLLKVYKWIWGQEDCNYPNGKGRWLSMNALLKHFQMNKKDLT